VKEKKLIYWCSVLNENEADMSMLSKLSNEFEIRICKTSNQNYWYEIEVDIYDSASTKNEKVMLYNRIIKESPDLVVNRSGWDSVVEQTPPNLLPDMMRDAKIPCAIWCSEQGILREWQYSIAKNYNWIWVNNKADLVWYKNRVKEDGENSKISFFPFGFVEGYHKRIRKGDEEWNKDEGKYITDCVCYGNPGFGYSEDVFIEKSRISERMLDAFIGLDNVKLNVYGRSSEWEKYKQYYRGTFPYNDINAVNSLAKIILGLSSNCRYGGYGTKLGKMMACGGCVIWPHTYGIEDDFINCKHLLWACSSEETRKLIKYYLENEKEREEIGKHAMAYAKEHLSYEENLRRILGEMR